MIKKLCIITARGGSKRIFQKNIKDFCGKPIISYAIETALEAGFFDEVMVSTDDQLIADIAKSYGAKVPFFRSEQNSDDYAGTTDVILEVIEEYRKLNQNFSHACCIYPTSPLLTVEKLKNAWEILAKHDADTVFPVLRFSAPIQRALRMDLNGYISMFHPENMDVRSQDLEPAFHDAGQFYFFQVERFLETRNLWTTKTIGIILNEMEAQDIDTIEDWEIAEFKYSYKNRVTRLLNN